MSTSPDSLASLARDVTAPDALTTHNTVAWHGAGIADHKALVDKWAALGFRTLSLSIYDDPAHPLFAAVMIKRAANSGCAGSS